MSSSRAPGPSQLLEGTGVCALSIATQKRSWGAPPFHARTELVWQPRRWGLVEAGRVLPVLCGGGRVMIDSAALGRETAAARAAEQDAAEERQRRLLVRQTYDQK